MYIRSVIGYFFAIGFLFLSVAKAGYIFIKDGTDEREHAEVYQIPVKIREVEVYFGKEKVSSQTKPTRFALNNLSNELDSAISFTEKDRSLSSITFHRVNNYNELAAMENALNSISYKLNYDVHISANGTLEEKAEKAIEKIKDDILDEYQEEAEKEKENKKEDRRELGLSSDSDG